MERRIGDTFRYKGKWVRVHEGRNFKCDDCVADNYYSDCWDKENLQKRGDCRHYVRTDGKPVIFKEDKINIWPWLLLITVAIWTAIGYLCLH